MQPIKIYDFCTENNDKNGDSNGRQNIRLPQFNHSIRFEISVTLIESKYNID